jgi:hypothetical protein
LVIKTLDLELDHPRPCPAVPVPLLSIAAVVPSYFFVHNGKYFPNAADPGCLSWIPDPDFFPSQADTTKTIKEEEIISCLSFFL